jgi:hypothetical protein
MVKIGGQKYQTKPKSRIANQLCAKQLIIISLARISKSGVPFAELHFLNILPDEIAFHSISR